MIISKDNKKKTTYIKEFKASENNLQQTTITSIFEELEVLELQYINGLRQVRKIAINHQLIINQLTNKLPKINSCSFLKHQHIHR